MIILLILTWAYSKPIQLLAIIIQLLSYSWLFAINGLLHQASLSLTISWSLLKLWWCYPTISSSVLPFSSCLLSFPASGSFPISQFFSSGGQIIGVSTSVSAFQMNIHLISFRIDWLDFLAVQGTLKSLLQHHSSKSSILISSPLRLAYCSPWGCKESDMT